MAGKPFALLGVNSDADREAMKRTLVEEAITWRSWWDDGSVNGPIQTQWQILRRPTIYVLDGNGVVRFKDIEIGKLDEAVDELVVKHTAN